MSSEKTDIWMPLYIGDYIASTQHLSAEQSGAYLHLLMHQWKNGELPAEGDALRRIARVESDTWSNTWVLLKCFFDLSTGVPVQRRLERIRAEWEEKKAKATAKALKAINTRWQKSRPDTPSKTGVLPENYPSPSPSPSPEKDINTCSESVERVYLAYPRKVGKGKAIPAIEKAVAHLGKGEDLPAMTAPEALEYLHKRVQAFARSPAGQAGDYTPHPASWFNGKRYLDDDTEWMRGNCDGTAQQRNGTRNPVSTATQRVSNSRSAFAAAAERFRGSATPDAA